MAHRVTSSMMVANYNRNQGAAQARMDRFQTQLATQRKIVRLSDDPVNVVKALNARSRLYDVEQYRKNLEDGRAWLTQTEGALMELNEVIKRAYELAVQAANDVLTDGDRDALSYEIRELRDHIETLANTTLGDKYIFGGYNVSSGPFVFNPHDAAVTFDADGYVVSDMTGVAYYNFDEYEVDMFDDGLTDLLPEIHLQKIGYEINVGQVFDVSVPGTDFLGFGQYGPNDLFPEDEGKSRNIYITLHEFFTVINAVSELNEDGIEILHKNVQPFIRRLQDLQKNALTQIAEVGGRIARMDLMLERYGTEELNYTQMLSDVEDLDQAEAIMWFSMAEAVYRAALGVGGRILPPTLVDFMR